MVDAGQDRLKSDRLFTPAGSTGRNTAPVAEAINLLRAVASDQPAKAACEMARLRRSVRPPVPDWTDTN